MLHLQEKNWEVLEVTKNQIDQFRRTMPLISDLHNRAMRPRHWEQIQVYLGSLLILMQTAQNLPILKLVYD